MNSDIHKPPQWILKGLSWFCPSQLLEEIEGDLMQRYEREVKSSGRQKANRKLTWRVLQFLRPGIVLRNKDSFNHSFMIRNYFTILFRSATRQKFNTATNLLCLTVSITFALLIGVFVAGEMKVNQDIQEVDRLFIVENHLKGTSDYLEFYTPAPLPKQSAEQYSTLIEEYYRFWDRNVTISKNDKHFRIQTMIGDPSFVKVFGFRVLDGEGVDAMKNPDNLVITESTAMRFFDKRDVAGETLSVSTERNGIREYKITAVIADPEKKNSVSDFMNMNAQVFLSLENQRDFFPDSDPDSWPQDIISYVKLAPGASQEDAEVAMNKLLESRAPSVVKENRSISLSPLSNYYLVTNHGAVQKLIVSLIAIVVLILLLAATNFINISIATSFMRLKEVGIRKVIGGMQRQVVLQFLFESIVFALASCVLALIAYELMRPYFGGALNTELLSVFNFPAKQWMLIFSGALLLGIAAGLYPAYYQSLSRPIESLKGKIRSVRGTLSFSRAIVGVQFFITLFIFIGAIVLSSQTNYFLNRDLGYDKEHVLVITSVPRLWNNDGFQKMETAKQAFLQSPKVKSVSLSWGSPGWNMAPQNVRMYRAGSSVDTGVRTSITCADANYQHVYGITILEGSFLRPTYQPNTIIINESAQKALSVKVGDVVVLEGFTSRTFEVAGVTKDFHFESLHEPVRPLAFINNVDYGAFRFFSFKLSPGSLSESVAEVEKLWRASFPNDPFDFLFTDEKLATLYATEVQLKKAASIATGLMLIIVLTGMVGLVSLNISRRTKEIGIRKVLGASVMRLLSMLSREYSVVLMIAFILAVPAAFFAATVWLQNFAYALPLQWWMFGVPVIVLLVLVLGIVIAQSLKTTLANPVKALRHE